MGIFQEDLKARIRLVLSEENFRTWIEPINFDGPVGEILTVSVPNIFFKEWIEENFAPVLTTIVKEMLGRTVKIEYTVVADSVGAERPGVRRPPQWPERSPFNPKYTFETFVVGPSNQFANAACVAVATNPGRAYNPLFVYGGTGLGKTHLLNAIGNFLVKEKHLSAESVCYLTAEVFTNELINSIRFERMDQFRNKFRKMQVLLIDDIQFIEGKERTQAEFFHTFNTLYESMRQIVITSDKAPRDIEHIGHRLKSRFEWGLIADIQPPDLETKVAILKRKADAENVTLPTDVAFFIAANTDESVRSLEGALTRLKAFSHLYGVPISLDLAERVMGQVASRPEEKPSIEAIVREVGSFFSVRPSDLRSKRRIRSIVLPRQVAIYLSRRLTDESLQSIGEKLGGKDHATVLHSIRKIDEEMKRNKELRDLVEKIERKLKSSREV